MIKLLIVDDSKAVHAFITSCLTKYPEFELTHVFNGQEGVDALKKQGASFDLIMLDWEMPVLTGPEAFDKFQESGTSVPPVLMMTTKNNPEDISLMVGKGVREYMLKPFTTEILIEKIEYCLDRSVSHVA